MNKKIMVLLEDQDLSNVKQGLHLVHALCTTENEFRELLAIPSEIQDFSDLLQWSGGQYIHAVYISWWLLLRFVEWGVPWAKETRRVRMHGLLTESDAFPQECSSLHLELLDLSHNHLDSLPIGIEHWNIKTLILRDNNLERMDFSAGFTQLEELDISENPLVKGSCVFGVIQQEKIHTLICHQDRYYLSSELSSDFASLFQSLQGLTTVDFRISSHRVSRSLVYPRRRFSAQDWMFGGVGHVIANPPFVSWNPPPPKAPVNWFHAFAPAVKQEREGKQKVDDAWLWVFSLPNIENVYLAEFDMRCVGNSVFPNIHDLRLYNSTKIILEQLNACFPNLSCLHLMSCQFMDEKEMTVLDKVETLSLLGCGLSNVPNFVQLIPHLQELDLSYNQIEMIPSWLFQRSIGFLDVWCNRISESDCATIIERNLWPNEKIKERMTSSILYPCLTNLELLQGTNQYNLGAQLPPLQPEAHEALLSWQDSRDERSLDAFEDRIGFNTEYVISQWLNYYAEIKTTRQINPDELILSIAHPSAKVRFFQNENIWVRLQLGGAQEVPKKELLDVLEGVLMRHEQGDFDLSLVQELSFAHIELTEVPSFVQRWPNLRSVSFAFTQIKELPAWLVTPSLESIDITGVPDVHIDPEVIRTCSEVYFFEKEISTSLIKGINWRKTKAIDHLFQHICDGVEQGLLLASSFRILDFSKTPLAVIPNNIGVLTSLIRLDVSHTQIKNIPTELFSLPLRYVNVRGLSIDMPIFATTLSIDKTQLDSWKDSFSQMKYLKVLDVGGQGLTSVPQEICMMTALETLDLRVNAIDSLPPNFAQIKNLQSVLLCNNNLSMFPPEEYLPPSLIDLDLRHNPLQNSLFSYPNRNIRIRH